jgi:hypothetical protein
MKERGVSEKRKKEGKKEWRRKQKECWENEEDI